MRKSSVALLDCAFDWFPILLDFDDTLDPNHALTMTLRIRSGENYYVPIAFSASDLLFARGVRPPTYQVFHDRAAIASHEIRLASLATFSHSRLFEIMLDDDSW